MRRALTQFSSVLDVEVTVQPSPSVVHVYLLARTIQLDDSDWYWTTSLDSRFSRHALALDSVTQAHPHLLNLHGLYLWTAHPIEGVPASEVDLTFRGAAPTCHAIASSKDGYSTSTQVPKHPRFAEADVGPGSESSLARSRTIRLHRPRCGYGPGQRCVPAATRMQERLQHAPQALGLIEPASGYSGDIGTAGWILAHRASATTSAAPAGTPPIPSPERLRFPTWMSPRWSMRRCIHKTVDAAHGDDGVAALRYVSPRTICISVRGGSSLEYAGADGAPPGLRPRSRVSTERLLHARQGRCRRPRGGGTLLRTRKWIRAFKPSTTQSRPQLTTKRRSRSSVRVPVSLGVLDAGEDAPVRILHTGVSKMLSRVLRRAQGW
ncbi:hypothetical protein DFH09DRAFT_1454052 [Mycena vulgaris]|nr:hypothetical protein DFH09DRAFT_1454052 [Mycena vulgaris]